MHRTYRNVFTVEECDKFTQIVGSREVQSGKNIYLEQDGAEFDIYETYGKPLTDFDRLLQHDRIIRARNPLVSGMDENLNQEFFNPLIEFMQPVVELVQKDWFQEASVENCYGVDYNSYPSSTSLEPHADITHVVAIVMIRNRNLEGGNLVLWEREKHNDMHELVKQFSTNTHVPDVTVDDLQTGDVFIYYDTPYFHAVEPVVAGVRQTAIIRWDNEVSIT
tara:strand:+ start:546 stop:1208 length:663 start_codon:yes stop_codon:yes gene_type:complete